MLEIIKKDILDYIGQIKHQITDMKQEMVVYAERPQFIRTNQDHIWGNIILEEHYIQTEIDETNIIIRILEEELKSTFQELNAANEEFKLIFNRAITGTLEGLARQQQIREQTVYPNSQEKVVLDSQYNESEKIQYHYDESNQHEKGIIHAKGYRKKTKMKKKKLHKSVRKPKK
jgi:hypothetical protein